MDRPRDSQTSNTRQPPQAASKPASLNAKASYLILYNAASALLWSIVLVRVLTASSLHSPSHAYPTTGAFVKWTQTLAGLEVLHSLLGIVRAPLLTTLMQVASRFLLVWGIINQFPKLATDERWGGSTAYCSMLCAWSVTEVIRYAYFAINLASGSVPGLVKWLRYNTFFVLYPLGIGSECFLVWLAATGPADKMRIGGMKISWGLWAVLAIYVPGSYVLFTHMLAQRKRVLRAEGVQKKTR